MPSSHYFQLNEIVDLIFRTNPRKLLDIGIGFGKYGFLAREYLELWDGRDIYNDWKRQIDGIEAFDSYITPVHQHIYNTIYKGNALHILPEMKEHYDLVLMIDVLEHFTFEEGLKILESCKRISSNILISVPKVVSAQETFSGNPFEEHKCQWKKKDFSVFSEKFFLPNPGSLICYAGSDSGRIGKEVKKARARQDIIHLLDLLRIKKPLKFLMGKSF